MHTKKPGLVRTWLVSLDEKRYCRVFIWRDAETLRTACGYDDETTGCCIGLAHIQRADGTRETGRKFAEIHLCGYLGAGYVAHEIQHLINYYSEFRSWSFDENDEAIASFAGSVTKNFWNEYYKDA